MAVHAFCEQRQLTETTFHHWHRELRRRAAAPPAFVPVTVVAATADPAPSIEVLCQSGHVVTVPGASPATLRELFQALATLAGGTPC
ncbi:IS66 family insertion sequence element accessory protein TnpA [Limnoglobus roseus]|uniref:IS66 family insertion sequence element accessory protein TnpA n=1 Tax=Limnoglobus roseus TaxID=2598579 RepID=UPI0036F1D187